MKKARKRGVADVEESSIDSPHGEKNMMVATCPSNRPGAVSRSALTEEVCTTPAVARYVREHGNPATPGRPGDLKDCDLTTMVGKLLGVLYATYDWIEPEWDENVPPRNTSGLSTRQQTVENGGRRKRINQFTHAFNPL